MQDLESFLLRTLPRRPTRPRNVVAVSKELLIPFDSSGNKAIKLLIDAYNSSIKIEGFGPQLSLADNPSPWEALRQNSAICEQILPFTIAYWTDLISLHSHDGEYFCIRIQQTDKNVTLVALAVDQTGLKSVYVRSFRIPRAILQTRILNWKKKVAVGYWSTDKTSFEIFRLDFAKIQSPDQHRYPSTFRRYSCKWNDRPELRTNPCGSKVVYLSKEPKSDGEVEVFHLVNLSDTGSLFDEMSLRQAPDSKGALRDPSPEEEESTVLLPQQKNRLIYLSFSIQSITFTIHVNWIQYNTHTCEWRCMHSIEYVLPTWSPYSGGPDVGPPEYMVRYDRFSERRSLPDSYMDPTAYILPIRSKTVILIDLRANSDTRTLKRLFCTVFKERLHMLPVNKEPLQSLEIVDIPSERPSDIFYHDPNVAPSVFLVGLYPITSKVAKLLRLKYKIK